MTKKKATADERRAALTGSIFAAASGQHSSEAKRNESPSIVGAALGAHSEGLSAEVKRLSTEREEAISAGQLLIEIEPDQIHDPLPRDRLEISFSDADFDALKRSIQDDGQLIPVTVRKSSGDDYEIAAGRRRVEACRQLGLRVLARVQELDDVEMLQLQFEENEQRADISSYERACWYRAVQKEYDFSTPELARRFNISQPMIVKYLKLGRIPTEIVEALDDARELSLGDSEKLHKTLAEIASSELAVEAKTLAGQGTKAQVGAMLSRMGKLRKTMPPKPIKLEKDGKTIAKVVLDSKNLRVSFVEDLNSMTRAKISEEISDLLKRTL